MTNSAFIPLIRHSYKLFVLPACGKISAMLSAVCKCSVSRLFGYNDIHGKRFSTPWLSYKLDKTKQVNKLL